MKTNHGLIGLGCAFLTLANAAPSGLRPGVGPRPLRDGQPPREQQSSEGAEVHAIDTALGNREAPLLFCIGLHIEPFGAQVSAIVGGKQQRPPRVPVGPRMEGIVGGIRGGGLDYNVPDIFNLHVGNIRTLAAIIEQHGGKLTVQAQTPFTRVVAESGNSILKDLQRRGHEIALHFHEDAHLGRHCAELPVATWTAVMREEIDLIRKAVDRDAPLRYWSGGNIYSGVLEAAQEAGLNVMSDHKNPRKQETDPALLAIHPWRPAGGPGYDDVAAFIRHDPRGKVIYLPDGIFADSDFRARKQGSDADYLNFLTDGLERSLRAARKDRVNVFHITVHPGELRGSPRAQFQVLAAWLTKVLDPLVAAGKVKWSTFSQMADTYIDWERANAAFDPKGKTAAQSAPPASLAKATPGPAVAASSRGLSGPGYITFAVNVHDWCHPRDSADTLKRLIEIFKHRGVKGDFYLTGPMVAIYREQCPDIIKALKESEMTISYHFRPPHPAYTGFSGKLAQLDGADLAAAVREVETGELDLATGAIRKERKGGYALVAEVFGAPPVCVSALCDTPKIKTALLKLYRELGARMTLLYHESGTKLDQPFEFVEGLLVRPSDFSITRWSPNSSRADAFWWDKLRFDAAAFDPATKLQKELANWKAPRPPLITALIHENNFYRHGPESWKAFYLRDRDPLPPPWNLKATDPSRPRPPQEVDKIFAAYDSMVAYAAKHLKVVTSSDLVALAK